MRKDANLAANQKSRNDAYPKAILHIDGDCFFTSCEIAKKPWLKGKPVVTGKERGIASSMSYEAKALGITRGMPVSHVRRNFPQVIVLSSDYETYTLYTARMYNIVRRYALLVEEYSMDECFADLTGRDVELNLAYEEIATRVKHEIDTELGMTFSVGLAPTKVLAKLASKWAKPSGLTFIPLDRIRQFLEKLPVKKIWGIGYRTAGLLERYHIFSALDFISKDESWVVTRMSKPYIEIWLELQGIHAMQVASGEKHINKSIHKTRTFTPASMDKTYIFAQLSKNIENACVKARRCGLVTTEIYFFLKTKNFRYDSMEIRLPYAISLPEEMIARVEEAFNMLYRPKTLYRATGVILNKLQHPDAAQKDLFGASLNAHKNKIIYEYMDRLSAKFGKKAVFLGSSFQAISAHDTVNSNGDASIALFKGETRTKRLRIPMLGEAY